MGVDPKGDFAGPRPYKPMGNGELTNGMPMKLNSYIYRSRFSVSAGSTTVPFSGSFGSKCSRISGTWVELTPVPRVPHTKTKHHSMHM